MTTPLLVTLALDAATFERLDALRRRYFPAERNLVPAHVSLFHSLPAEDAREIQAELGEAAEACGPIPLKFGTIRRTGKGIAASVEAPGLATLHARLARAFAAYLTPQDRQPFRPHATIMNKAGPLAAALAFAELSAAWEPITGRGEGLLLWEYLGGPWRFVARFPFAAGSGTMEA